MKALLPSCLFVLALLAACGPSPRQRTAAVLDDVESYINNRPDSALAVLECIEADCVPRPKSKARFGLLKAVALDKCYFDDGSFASEMEFVAEWYALHGKAEDRARAFFYLADQQNDAGEIAEAAVNFTIALDLADRQSDWFLSGMASRSLSEIYLSEFDFPRSLEYANKSVNAFVNAQKPAHVAFSKIKLAEAYYNNGFLSRCLQLCDSLQSDVNIKNNARYLVEVLATEAVAFIYLNPPQVDSTLVRLAEAEEIFPLSAQQHAIYAWALSLKGERQDAEIRINYAYKFANNRRDSLLVQSWDARIAELHGERDRQLSLQEQIVDATDMEARNTVLHSVDRAQARYYHQQEYLLTQEIRQNRMYFLGIFLFTVLFSSFFSVVAYLRRKQLKEKEKMNEALSQKLALYGTTVEDTLDFGFDVLNRLSDAYYHPNTARQQTFREIMERYVTDIASRERLGNAIEQNINIIHDDVISRLRKEIPALKDKDIKLFSLYLFGFSYKAISEFFPRCSSVNAIYSRVSRLRKTIAESGSAQADFFLSFLEKRPTNGLSEVQ